MCWSFISSPIFTTVYGLFCSYALLLHQLSTSPTQTTYILLNIHCYKGFIIGPQIYKEKVYVTYYALPVKPKCKNFQSKVSLINPYH